MSGLGRIMTERARQQSIAGEQWSLEHDDHHDSCELTMAAVAYAFHAVGQVNGVCDPDEAFARFWPFEREGWNPDVDPLRNLTKAGALIAAEIDRLERAAKLAPADRQPIGSEWVSLEHSSDGGKTWRPTSGARQSPIVVGIERSSRGRYVDPQFGHVYRKAER